MSYITVIVRYIKVVQKLYCYVDETGQDTAGRFFAVSVLVTKAEREKLLQQLEQIEERSGKKNINQATRRVICPKGRGIRGWHQAGLSATWRRAAASFLKAGHPHGKPRGFPGA